MTVFLVQVKTLMSHRLIEPTFNLAEKICKKHERLLDVYCRTDHICICSACAEASHKSHDITSIDHEYKKKTVSSRNPRCNRRTRPQICDFFGFLVPE